MFNLSFFEILVVSLFFVTALACVLTYYCCSKSLKIYEKNKNISDAINKLRVLDQYILSKFNLIIALFYFVISYLFVDSYIGENNYIFFISCILSFVMTFITNFVSRLCYCYTCNVLLETKLNEFECLILNFKRLVTTYAPFFIVSLVIPSIYILDFSILVKNVISIVSLIVILIIWIVLTPKITILSNRAKKINKNSLLRHRLEKLFELHGINNFELYYWDTSRSKESNAFVSGIFKYHVFLSSTLIEDVTLPELETVITHEIGHIKNKHLLKLMVGKFFVIGSIAFMTFCPYIFDFDNFSRMLFYFLTVLIGSLEFIFAVSVERNYENQADIYASYFNDSKLFASALKKITKYEEKFNKVDNLFQVHSSSNIRIKNVEEKSKK